MYEDLEAVLNPQMAEVYLRRIGIEQAPRVAGQETLNALMFAHQCRIPFENLDVYDGKLDIQLSTGKLFEKLVLRCRGGYCFELNALFCKLLTFLGFEVRACLARVWNGQEFTPPPMHRVNLVCLEGMLHLCDVGFGGLIPAEAFPLEPGIRTDIMGECFSLEEDERFGWTLFSHAAKARAPLISFNPGNLPEVDFIAPNYYCSHAPDSRFVGNRIVNLRTPRGSVQLFGSRFKLVRDGVTAEEMTVPSRQDLIALLRNRFGIDAEGLGPSAFSDLPGALS
jgi:N-hydroxyarylamine O-acetyltransferase